MLLCYDVDASGDENHKAIKRSRKKKASTSDMHRFFQKSGIFVILASLPFQPDDILDVYYTRQQVEQYFDLGKGLARLIPLRVHNEDRVLGHLLLSQIAATVNLYIQKKMRWSATDSVEMFLGLRNQKCAVYSTRIVPNEPQSAATQYYNKFKIKCPTAIDTRGSELRPIYGL